MDDIILDMQVPPSGYVEVKIPLTPFINDFYYSDDPSEFRSRDLRGFMQRSLFELPNIQLQLADKSRYNDLAIIRLCDFVIDRASNELLKCRYPIIDIIRGFTNAEPRQI